MDPDSKNFNFRKTVSRVSTLEVSHFTKLSDTPLTSLHAKQIIAVEYVLTQVDSGHVTAF